MKKVIFLDRDGVINEDLGYVFRVEDFKFCFGIFEALKGFLALDYELVVVTNQSGIARGYYTQEQFELLSRFMLDKFNENGIKISKIYFCPHLPEVECECRKPKPGMIIKAASELKIDLKKSIMIGDKPSDIEAAKRAGVGRSFLIDGVNIKNVKEIYEILKKESV